MKGDPLRSQNHDELKSSTLGPIVIYLPPFGDAGDRLERRVFASPQKRLRDGTNRGSDRKLGKCQNSINKQIMNIVTLFMQNKN